MKPIRIKITKLNSSGRYKYEADFMDMPGSPLVGRAKTKKEAIGELIMNNQFEAVKYIELLDMDS